MPSLRSKGKGKAPAAKGEAKKQKRGRKPAKAPASSSIHGVDANVPANNTRRRSSRRESLDQPSTFQSRRLRSTQDATSHEKLGTPLKRKRRRTGVEPGEEEQLPSSQPRQLRSTQGETHFEKLPYSPKKKRRRTIAETQEGPTENQPDEDAEAVQEEQPPQNQSQPRDDDDDESAPQEPEFFKNINKRIHMGNEQPGKLPKLRPEDNLENATETEVRLGIIVESQDEDAEMADDDGGEESIEEPEVDSAPTKRQKTSDHPQEQPEPEGSDKPETRPNQSHPEPSQSKRRGKRRQRTTPVFREADRPTERVASPDLGLSGRQPQASSSSYQQSQDTHASDGPGREAGDQDEQEKQRQKSLSKGNKAAKKKKTLQPQSEQPQAEPSQSIQPQQEETEEQSDDEDDKSLDSGPDEEPENQEQQEPNDSILLDPPEAGASIETTEIRSKLVQKLITITTYPGWIGKRKWEGGVQRQAECDKALAGPSNTLSTDLLVKIYDLWKLCSDVPRAPHFEAQLADARKKKEDYSNLISRIGKLVDRLSSKIAKMEPGNNSENGRLRVNKLYEHVIPMLILAIKQAFLAGFEIDSSKDGNEQKMAKYGVFTSSSLELLVRLTGWADRLCHVILSWHELNFSTRNGQEMSEKLQHRKEMTSAIQSLKDALQEGANDLEHKAKAPERRKKAIEADKRMRRAREETQRRRQEEQDRQMQRFIASTHKLQPTQHPRPSQPAVYRPDPTATQSVTVSSQPDSGDAYFEKYGGWRFWEDDRLLNTIRNTRNPDYEVVAKELLSERQAPEIEERARVLKARIRRNAERKGQQPPSWSYEEEG
ncbi:hypothetical protein FZEAL_3701 [Fusarium zealandicum]|uniref:Uncharacterized protein n=1 Tax=Fusarium zealandicum TaxID=1053134 RepID=A0A8H4UP21_9HYPO|nr:hypothetical protein FZEAL_3701 [Fusarium zealandicum]